MSANQVRAEPAGPAVPGLAAQQLATGPVHVEIEQVAKTYVGAHGPVLALSEVDLTVRRGEFVCVVGPSGCGKSTLLRMLAGLDEPSAGRISLHHEDEHRAAFTVAFQDYSIFPWKTVSANVAFGLRQRGHSRARARRVAAEWIDRLGLSGFENAYPGALSGGMKQRVSLARALALDPELLLLDEPFAALDAQLRQLMQDDLLEQWNDESSRTALMVTHSLEEALLLGDTVVLMSARPGRIRDVFAVPFDRPRRPSLREDPEFARLKGRIWEKLRDEVQAAMAIDRRPDAPELSLGERGESR